MNSLNKFMTEQFGVSISESFIKKAIYHSAIDQLEYITVDEVTVCSPVSDSLTLVLDLNDKIVGFKLNGFKATLENWCQNTNDVQVGDTDSIEAWDVWFILTTWAAAKVYQREHLSEESIDE